MLSSDELVELRTMAHDLGVAGVMTMPLELVNARVHLALWKRLKVAEIGFNLLADQRLANGCNCPCRPAA